MANSKKYEIFRQYISSFIQGPNVDAVLNTLADDAHKLEELSIAVTDQLTISTASGVYLDKRLADKGITRPPELGMSDLAFRKMGISLIAQKQLTELIHTILETFYGEEAVRATITSTAAEPYNLEDGMELFLSLEDGSQRAVAFQSTDFNNINQATAAEVAAVITRALRQQNLNAFAQVDTDLVTGGKFVKVFGGAKGPYSTVSILGGEANTVLRFPNIRGTELNVNDTAWEITRTKGSTLRFRWVGNSKPALNLVFPGDLVMIYGQNFKDFELDGTFVVSNVRPPLAGPSLDAGWFEITNDAFSGLRATQEGTSPPPNIPPDTIYSYTVVTANFEDLMFMRAVKALPNQKSRYALAWEPAGNQLKIYMPATTGVVSRGLEGASHMHMLYDEYNLDGAFGNSATTGLTPEVLNNKVEIVSDRIVRYRQLGYDNMGTGGELTWDATTVAIEYAKREQFYTTVYCVEPHGIPVDRVDGGRQLSDKIIDVYVERIATDDPVNTFPSPYVVDLTAPYTVRSEFVTSRQKVFAGSTLTTLEVDGILPNEPGELLFNLNEDNEEGPVRFIGVQAQGAPNTVSIASISQNGFTITITTTAPHGAIPGSEVSISGTSSFDGQYPVTSAPSSTTLVCTSGVSQVAAEAVGSVTVLTGAVRSTLILDPSNRFRFDHGIGSSLTLMSSRTAYDPANDGSDYPFYVTGVAEGRVFAQEVIEGAVAAGINIEILIVYPDDTGLGNQGGSDDEEDPPTSDKVWVWGV